MFVIDINYTVELDIIDQYLAEHRAWLDAKYKDGSLLCSGPKTPRTGGILISLLKDCAQVEALVKDDPFYKEGLAEYSITEFTPVKYHGHIHELI